MGINLSTPQLIMSSLQTLIETAFDTLKEIFRPNMSLDEVAEKYSPIIDDIIKKYEKEGVKFSAGKFKIGCVDEKNFRSARQRRIFNFYEEGMGNESKNLGNDF